MASSTVLPRETPGWRSERAPVSGTVPAAVPDVPAAAPDDASGEEVAPPPDPDREHDRIATARMARFRDEGGEEAFEALYAHSRDAVLMWIRSLLRQSPAHLDALELLQDTFVNVYRYPRSFRDEHDGSFRVWVRTIAGNLVRRAKGRAARNHLAALGDSTNDPVDPQAGPEAVAALDEEAAGLRSAWGLFLGQYLAAWRQLSQRDRRALHLVEVERRTYAEAAEELGVRPANMKMIVFRSRRRLAAHMGRALSAAVGGPAPLRAAV